MELEVFLYSLCADNFPGLKSNSPLRRFKKVIGNNITQLHTIMLKYSTYKVLQYIPTVCTVATTKSDNNILRQSSTFGIAKAINVAPHIIIRQLPIIISALLELINSPEANDEDNEGTTENAIFAIGSLCTNPIYKDIIIRYNK